MIDKGFALYLSICYDVNSWQSDDMPFSSAYANCALGGLPLAGTSGGDLSCAVRAAGESVESSCCGKTGLAAPGGRSQ